MSGLIHIWDAAMNICRSCGVTQEFVFRYGETYCIRPGAKK